MKKATLVFPALTAKTTQEKSAEVAEAIRRGYPTINGKQAVGKSTIASPYTNFTITSYLMEDGTAVTLDPDNNILSEA